MYKPSYVENLYQALMTAVDCGIITDWTAEGPNVLLRRGSVELAVPVLKAVEHVTALVRRHDTMAADSREIPSARGVC